MFGNDTGGIAPRYFFGERSRFFGAPRFPQKLIDVVEARPGEYALVADVIVELPEVTQ